MIRLRRFRFCRASGLLIAFSFALFVCLQFLVSHEQTVLKWRPVENAREGRKLFQKQDYMVGDGSNSVYLLEPTDERLVSHVRSLIRLPTLDAYNLSRPLDQDYSRGQSARIDQFLNSKENGVFVEIGALDGETHSVSLFFEKSRHWKGLLIEPKSVNYQALLQKHRTASTLQACVKTNSSDDMSQTIVFEDGVPCLFIETILLANGIRHIDLLSVDAKDQELAILKTLPFETFTIDTITVEFSDGSNAQGSILAFLDSKNYVALHQFVNHPLQKSDLVFVRKEIFH